MYARMIDSMGFIFGAALSGVKHNDPENHGVGGEGGSTDFCLIKSDTFACHQVFPDEIPS